jgi:hypothetical protein
MQPDKMRNTFAGGIDNRGKPQMIRAAPLGPNGVNCEMRAASP